MPSLQENLETSASTISRRSPRSEVPRLCLLRWLWVNLCRSLVLNLVITSAQGPVYYCSEISAYTTSVSINDTEGTISSNYEGESHYGNNRQCMWLLDAGAGNRVQLTVKISQLQWAPDNAICSGYDFMEIRDGDDFTSRLIVTWCGDRNPEHIISSGRYLRVYFSTNEQNVYKYTGIRLEYSRFSFPGSCPHNWSPYGSNCYRAMTTSRDWIRAQHHCTYQQANLATVTSDQQQNFITGLGSLSKVWIGLNDIVKENHYKWVYESQPATMTRWSGSGHINRADKDCVVLETNTKVWVESFCDQIHNMHASVCQMKKDAVTTVYPIPEAGIDTDPHFQSNVQWILIGTFLSLVIVIPVIIYVVWKCKKRVQSASTPVTPTHSYAVPVAATASPTGKPKLPPPYREGATSSVSFARSDDQNVRINTPQFEATEHVGVSLPNEAPPPYAAEYV